MSRISRRSFTVGVGGAALSLAIPSVFSQESRKVVVVGAGLAGLAAAYELAEAGVDVTVIEQSNRPGGRVKTIRDRFADGAWVDVGGQTSGGGYANFFYYATKFGLAFEQQSSPAVPRRPDVLLHAGGKMWSVADLREQPGLWPVDLNDDEKALAPLRLLGHYLRPIATEIGAVERILDPQFVQYDELSLEALLKQRGASDAAIRMIDHTLNYNSVSSVSALSALRDMARILQGGRGGAALNLANGNSSLPEAFAKSLGDRVRYGTRLTGVQRRDDGITLQVETNTQSENLYAASAVIAIPFTALRKITIEPELPAGRQKIIDELPYTQIAQTYLQTRSRFWETDAPVAMVVSDGPLERLFNASDKMQGERGLLVNWVNGSGTQAIRSNNPAEHVETVTARMEELWPGCRDEIEVTLSNNWSNTYVEGAYAHYAPGQMAAFAKEIPQPIGRLHFAGEHTELVAPGMEGALTSGKRAASEVLAAIA